MKNTVFILGAGISVASGLPTYNRDSNFVSISNGTHWRENLQGIWDIYGDIRRKSEDVLKVVTLAHSAMSNYLTDHENAFVITQNVDGIDSYMFPKDRLICMHGNCHNTIRINKKTYIHEYGIEDHDYTIEDDNYWYRPDVVLFGDKIRDYHQIIKRVNEAERIILVGTSLDVDSTRSIAFMNRNAEIYAFNLTAYTDEESLNRIDYLFLGDCQKTLPLFLKGKLNK